MNWQRTPGIGWERQESAQNARNRLGTPGIGGERQESAGNAGLKNVLNMHKTFTETTVLQRLLFCILPRK